jgi:hypothetical protein
MEPVQMGDVDAAYLAGIIDGEGYIGLNRKSAGAYSLRIAVKSTCHALPARIRAITGTGTIREIIDKRKLKGPGFRQIVHEWRAFDSSAGEVLAQIVRHLIVKVEQARLGIEYQSQSPADRRFTGERFHAELMRLNGRQTRLRANNPTNE